jgi:hypothetical protein
VGSLIKTFFTRRVKEPLDDRFAEGADADLKPSYMRGMKRLVYLPSTVGIPESSSPNDVICHYLHGAIGVSVFYSIPLPLYPAA